MSPEEHGMRVYESRQKITFYCILIIMACVYVERLGNTEIALTQLNKIVLSMTFAECSDYG